MRISKIILTIVIFVLTSVYASAEGFGLVNFNQTYSNMEKDFSSIPTIKSNDWDLSMQYDVYVTKYEDASGILTGGELSKYVMRKKLLDTTQKILDAVVKEGTVKSMTVIDNKGKIFPEYRSFSAYFSGETGKMILATFEPRKNCEVGVPNAVTTYFANNGKYIGIIHKDTAPAGGMSVVSVDEVHALN